MPSTNWNISGLLKLKLNFVDSIRPLSFSLFLSIWQYLDHIKHTVIENVKCLTGAPSVQMQEVPPDFMCLESMEDQRDPDERHDDDSR